MSHNDQQNMMGRTCQDQHPHPENIQTFQNNQIWKEASYLLVLSMKCVKSYREGIENEIIK